MSSGTGRTLYTIGYGTRSVEEVAYILHAYRVGALIDVRAAADSDAPQFDPARLEKSLPTLNLDYIALGKELGTPANLHRADGTPDYDTIERLPIYQFGIAHLSRLVARYQEGAGEAPYVAILSAEADPAASLRERLIARTLRDAEWTIRHIRADGTIAPD